ncbi:phosphomannomutase [Nitrososphaera sp.]|uniref:phosphomannomutase n=1 Tax=Nitrososphaera sp. TaxID=1971748 RepID=UPI00317D409F
MKVSISGVRGIYGQDLTLNEVSRFSSLFAGVAGEKCIVARDTRPSGRIISQVVSASLMSAGVNVYNLGVAPTPAAFREARKYGAGVMITASHNPLEWNGLKFIVQGRGLFEEELARMLASQPAAGGFGTEHDAGTAYVDDVAALIGSGGAKVAIDCGGGASCGYAEQLFKKLGMKCISINGVPGISSRGPDPTADELADLRSLVKSSNLDFGFALDPDGDRLVVVKDGQKLSPDSTMLLCIARAVEMGVKNFVSSIDSSVAIDRYVKNRGGRIEHSKVGEANVVKKMLETGAEAGGEGSSAGFIMPKFNMCRDGLLAAGTIATLDKKMVADCLAFASQFSQIRSKVPADSSLHAKVIEKLPDMLKAESAELIMGDGVKAIIDDDSWALVRPSNTEHAIRVSVESKAGRAESLFKKMSEKVQRAYDEIK